VLRRIFETKQREAGRYVTRIASWQQIVLGRLEKGGGEERDGRGIRLIVLYLLKYVDEESEGKLILKSVLIFKDLKCLIKQNNVLLSETHKHSPNSNTVIKTKVMAVTRSKHSDRHNEPDYVI
jgi:hypothetical protein